MSDWRVEHEMYLNGLRQGRIETKLDQIIRLLESSKTSSQISEWAKDCGRTLLRTLMPYLTPYVWAFLTGLGALAVGLFKAFTRGWLG